MQSEVSSDNKVVSVKKKSDNLRSEQVTISRTKLLEEGLVNGTDASNV